MQITVRELREEIIFVGNAVEGIKGAASWVKDVAVSAWEGVAGAVSTAVGVVQKGIADFFAPKMVTEPEVQTAGWVQDVESKFKKNTNMNSYATKLANYYSTDENPLSQERALQRLCEANGGITPAELQEKVNRGEPIKEPGDMCWNKDVQKMYVSGNESGYNEAMSLMKKIAGWSPWGSGALNTIDLNALNQDPGGALSQMLQENPFNYNSTTADSFAGSACMANATYFALAGSGANVGTPEKFFNEYIGKDIDPVNARMNTSTAKIAEQYGKVQITFTDYDKIASQDFEYGKATFERWSRSSGQYINHTVAIYKDNSGSVRIYADTGRNASGYNGKLYDDVIHKDRFKYFQYIKK